MLAESITIKRNETLYRDFINSETMLCFASVVTRYTAKQELGDNGIFVAVDSGGNAEKICTLLLR